MLCDRDTTNIAKSQKGFLNFIIRPAYELATKLLPKLQFALDAVDTNLKTWEGLEDEYEELKNNGNRVEDKIERKFQLVKNASNARLEQLNSMFPNMSSLNSG